MDAIYMGWNQATRRLVAGVVAAAAATLVIGGTAMAAPRATLDNAAQQASSPVSSTYFGVVRSTDGYIPGL